MVQDSILPKYMHQCLGKIGIVKLIEWTSDLKGILVITFTSNYSTLRMWDMKEIYLKNCNK